MIVDTDEVVRKFFPIGLKPGDHNIRLFILDQDERHFD
jgi:hypothetical protein